MRKRNLFDHKKIHEEELNPESKCMLCEINFKNNKSLIDHIMQQHPKKDQLSYKCISCSRNFKSSDMQKDHEESAHTDQNEHNCLECDHQTNSKYNLN